MIDLFVQQWEKNKDLLKKYFETTNVKEYDSYEKLIKIVLDKIINTDNDVYGETINLNKIIKIDYGDYQGTLIFVFPADCYQPSPYDTYYTTVSYGSCSGCDTLMGIVDVWYDDSDLPTKSQVDSLMTLSLHLIQNTYTFKDWED